jgi:hypothetical protein
LFIFSDLSYVHHGEFEKAVDDLHRYFDYTAQAMAHLPAGGNAGTGQTLFVLVVLFRFSMIFFLSSYPLIF